MSEQQTFVFEKFMQDLEKKEDELNVRREARRDQEENWHARRLLRKYREHPLNLRTYEKQK